MPWTPGRRTGKSPTGSARPPGGVRVWFYGDYGCPFSYVTHRRLELLAAERPLDVRWRPLALGPGVRGRRGAGVGAATPDVPAPGPAGGAGGTDAGAAEDEDRLAAELRRAADELDLPLRSPIPTANTREALQAAEFARDLGPAEFERLHRALFRALLGEGRDLGSRPVLLEVAGEAGVDREGLERALEDGRYAAELEAAGREAVRYGITGTPALLFGRFLLIGAAPLPELRRAAERAERDGGADR